ncbi:MAG: hypothetical protein IJ209_06850 [Bacteroidaceae bacterium]|nr:hypothetical protein [Bacteroidaceae bacterium]
MEAIDLESLLAILLSCSIPIVTILMVFITMIKKKSRETELRLAIVQAGTDADTAKVLIDQQQKKRDKYSSLRWGCILAGMGLGALCDALIGISPKHDIYFWFIIAAGMGVGLLTSFVIEYKLSKNSAEAVQE